MAHCIWSEMMPMFLSTPEVKDDYISTRGAEAHQPFLVSSTDRLEEGFKLHSIYIQLESLQNQSKPVSLDHDDEYTFYKIFCFVIKMSFYSDPSETLPPLCIAKNSWRVWFGVVFCGPDTFCCVCVIRSVGPGGTSIDLCLLAITNSGWLPKATTLG